MKSKLGFIVIPNPSLFDALKNSDYELTEYFSENHILTTEECDYESAFEGWKHSIRENAKITFIRTTVLSLDFDENEMKSIFGEFDSNVELFDKWWVLEDADCETIPTTWLGT